MNRLANVLLVLGALNLVGTAACKKEPDLATVHEEAGDDHFRKQEWKQAAEQYGKALEANPKNEKLWEKKAFAHMEGGDMDGADATILKTIDLKPDAAKKAEVYRNLASLYQGKSVFDRAEKYYQEAVKIDPNDDVSLGWLAEFAAQRGGARDGKALAVPEHLDKALEYYEKVIAIKPDLPATYINKRVVMFKYMEYVRQQKEVAEAQQNSKDKAKAEEAKAAVEKHQARMDEFKQKIDEATKKFTEAQKKAPKPPQ